jgi:transcriptional regulator with XRE-family HTH domain
MTLAELGRRTGYSAAKVSRFERGVAPLTDIAILRRFADALEIAPQALGLAQLGTPARSDVPGVAEALRPYTDRGMVTRQQWNGIIRDAADELWLYGMAEFGHASDDAVPGILTRATSRGCRVRILLLNPGSPVSTVIRDDDVGAGRRR